MAITVESLVKRYIPLLDEIFANASVTSALSGDPAITQAGANTHTIRIPKISLDGLADYSRSGGYASGDVSVEWEEVSFNYDRGRKFQVDAMDDEETFHIAFGRLAAEFMRTKVALEADAFTFSQIASTPGIQLEGEYIGDGKDFLEALLAATVALDEKEVPTDQRYLYTTPTLRKSVQALDTFKSREALGNFAGIIETPQTRFYTAVDLKDGKSPDEITGHFAPAADAAPINYMIVYKPALIKFDKHVVTSVITPEANQTHDAYMVKYRKYGIVDLYENKRDGVYVSYAIDPPEPPEEPSGGTGSNGSNGNQGS
jgi:hypothetical protein